MATFTDNEIKRVLILIAMEAEAQPLLDKLKLMKKDKLCAFTEAVAYEGMYNGCEIALITNGKSVKFGVDNVGTVPAALSAYMGIEQFKPDLIINAGTAGGFKRHGCGICDAFISTSVYNHDRRIPIPGFTEYGKGDYSSIACAKMVEVKERKKKIICFFERTSD